MCDAVWRCESFFLRKECVCEGVAIDIGKSENGWKAGFADGWTGLWGITRK